MIGNAGFMDLKSGFQGVLYAVNSRVPWKVLVSDKWSNGLLMISEVGSKVERR